MLRLILKAAAGAALAMGLLALIVPSIQSRLMYFPDTQYYTPAQAGLVDVSERVIETADGARVIAWHAAARAGQPTLLYFHGNAGSLETRNERFRRYMARGVGVFMMTYRGFGGSSGVPSEASNVADAKLAYDMLVALGVAPEDIVVYGESLGSGVAVQLAASRPVAGVILDAPYTSMVDLARLHYPLIPGRWFMTDRYETRKHIAGVTAPLLIVHGEEDTIVPVEMGREVHALAPGPKTLRTFSGAGHADHYMFGSYETIFNWLDALPRTSAQLRQQG